MPYLSRVWINPLRTGAQRMLRNPQVLHAALLGGISRQPATERVLWRLELESDHRAGVLVLTESRPSWEHLVEQAGWPSAEEPQAVTRSYDPLLDRVVAGAEFAFRLRANPVSSMRQPAKPSAAQQQALDSTPRARGVRVPHRTARHQLAWFSDRAERWGFAIPGNSIGLPEVRIVGRERVVFDKAAERGKRRVVIETATFEGRLRVLDAALARRSLLGGVGHAKAYGCGLITLAPIAEGS